MSRVINTNNPGKIRNHCQRTIAEILRRLSKKAEIDADAKDMAAMIVFMLVEINRTVDQTVDAWEKRDYWIKAERFMREWEWSREAAANFDDVIRNEAWDLLPELLAGLFPRFADIQVKRMTRSPSLWADAHQQLLAQEPPEQPW